MLSSKKKARPAREKNTGRTHLYVMYILFQRSKKGQTYSVCLSVCLSVKIVLHKVHIVNPLCIENQKYISFHVGNPHTYIHYKLYKKFL